MTTKTRDKLAPLRRTAKDIEKLEARINGLRHERNRLILDLYDEGGFTERQLAEASGTTKGWVYRVRQGKAATS